MILVGLSKKRAKSGDLSKKKESFPKLSNWQWKDWKQ
jgi:hypothetical protein